MGVTEHLLHGIFLHFFMDCFVFFGCDEVLDVEGSERRRCLRSPVTREDLKIRKLRLLQEISEDRETMRKHSGL